MPGLSARSAQKKSSRIGEGRKRSNQMFADAACRGEFDDCQFGKVYKMLGGPRVAVITWDNADPTKVPKERQAVIRNQLRKKGCTPIHPDDIVVLSCRDFETRSSSSDAVFDLVAIVDKRSAQKLVKSKELPAWMGKSVTDVSSDQLDEFDLFDYSDEIEEEFDSDDDSDSNVVSKPSNLKGKKGLDPLKGRNRGAAAAPSKERDDDEIDIDRI